MKSKWVWRSPLGGSVASKIEQWFPEHQIYFRSNGQVRFIRISPRAQMLACAAGLTVLFAVGSATANFYFRASALSTKEQVVMEKERQLQLVQERMREFTDNINVVKGDLTEVASRLEQRHRALEEMIGERVDAEDLPAKTAAAAKTGQETAQADTDDAMMSRYTAIEREQLALAETANSAVEARYKEREAMLRRLGISPRQLIARSSFGSGGPLLEMADEDGLEPQFKDLFLSWTRLDQLETAMLSIPSYTPVKNFTYTSGFGRRRDPFRGTVAMHAGVDMSGRRGEPIYAAADGVVVRAAYAGAYGKLIEIDHGRGITTRYAHLANTKVKTGQKITQGQLIGGMGSTGRSTGTHLHYEVRVNGNAVNPMPFLEASADVLEIQKRAASKANARGDS